MWNDSSKAWNLKVKQNEDLKHIETKHPGSSGSTAPPLTGNSALLLLGASEQIMFKIKDNVGL